MFRSLLLWTRIKSRFLRYQKQYSTRTDRKKNLIWIDGKRNYIQKNTENTEKYKNNSLLIVSIKEINIIYLTNICRTGKNFWNINYSKSKLFIKFHYKNFIIYI